MLAVCHDIACNFTILVLNVISLALGDELWGILHLARHFSQILLLTFVNVWYW